jgi:transcriptional regulator with XRE-family HTH domain
MLSLEDDVEAYALRKQGWTISAIARHLGRTRSTIRAYLAGGRAPGQRQRSAPDAFAAFAPYVGARLGEDPHVWASALYDEVQRLGYARSYPRFTHELRIRSLRPHCEPCAGVRGRPTTEIEHPPGVEALCGKPHSPSFPGGCSMPSTTSGHRPRIPRPNRCTERYP